MKFRSKYSELRMVITPSRHEIISGMKRYVPGKRIEFSNGFYETKNKEEIKFIRSHQMFGTKVFSEEPTPDIPTDEGKKIEVEKKVYKGTLATSCPECSFSAATDDGLKIHMKAHEGK